MRAVMACGGSFPACLSGKPVHRCSKCKQLEQSEQLEVRIVLKFETVLTVLTRYVCDLSPIIVRPSYYEHSRFARFNLVRCGGLLWRPILSGSFLLPNLQFALHHYNDDWPDVK